MKFLVIFVISLLTLKAYSSNVSSLSYSSTNVGTSAYVTLVASTPINTSQLLICDTSGKILKIASGAANSEVDLFTVPVSSCMLFPLAPVLPSGTRLSIKAIDASATSGYNTVSFLP